MSKLWIPFLKAFNFIGDNSGCHQIPERCFKVRGYIFPICARCTGVALGQLAALVSGIIGLRVPAALCMLLLAVMAADWVLQHLGIRESTNPRRLITGLMAGFGLFHIYFLIFDLVFK